MLAALSRAALARLRFPLGDLTKPEVRALAARGRPRRRAQARLAGPLLPRRHRARELPRPPRRHALAGPATSLDRAGAVVGRHDGHHGFTVGQRRGLGGGSREPLYVLATDAARQHRHRRPARRSSPRPDGPRARACACTARSPTPCACATARRRCAAASTASEIHLDEPFDGAAPGQTAVFLAGDAIVGCATIAGEMTDRRDPRDVPALLRGARPPAAALGVARAVGLRPVGAADDGGHAPARAVLPRRGAAAAPAPDDRPEVLPHDRHRQRRQHRRGT